MWLAHACCALRLPSPSHTNLSLPSSLDCFPRLRQSAGLAVLVHKRVQMQIYIIYNCFALHVLCAVVYRFPSSSWTLQNSLDCFLCLCKSAGPLSKRCRRCDRKRFRSSAHTQSVGTFYIVHRFD